jgi:hypothetical protein
MPTESLILRRSYPVPVTLSDLKLARLHMYNTMDYIDDRGLAWHTAIKEATGAVDEVYAVIDGREVRVAVIDKVSNVIVMHGGSNIDGVLNDLLIKADEQGYWQNPHEIVHVLSERPVSFAAVERAVNVGWCAKGGAA